MLGGQLQIGNIPSWYSQMPEVDQSSGMVDHDVHYAGPC